MTIPKSRLTWQGKRTPWTRRHIDSLLRRNSGEKKSVTARYKLHVIFQCLPLRVHWSLINHGSAISSLSLSVEHIPLELGKHSRKHCRLRKEKMQQDGRPLPDVCIIQA